MAVGEPYESAMRKVESAQDKKISRFVDHASSAHDPHARKKLQTLMLAELNGYGFNLEHLEVVQGLIQKCQARIDQHEQLIQKTRVNGYNVATAERVLNNLIELQECFWSHHQAVLEALNRSKCGSAPR